MKNKFQLLFLLNQQHQQQRILLQTKFKKIQKEEIQKKITNYEQVNVFGVKNSSQQNTDKQQQSFCLLT